MTDPDAPFVPAGRTLDLPGRGDTFVRLHDGPHGAPTVALLHGWTNTADLNWFGTYRPLAERASFVAIDHRGHGRGLRTERPFALEAAADDLAAALERLDRWPVIAVGYSMGGPIALHLAQRHPHLVSGLVMVATAQSFHTTHLSRLQWYGLPLLALAFRLDVERVAIAHLVTEAGSTDTVVGAWRDRLIGEAKRSTPVDLMGAARSLRVFDAGPFAGDIRLPAASVVTMRDRLVAPRDQRALAEKVGGLVIELDADHDAFLRQRASFAAAVIAGVEAVIARQQAERPVAQLSGLHGDALARLAESRHGHADHATGRGRRLVRRLRRRSTSHALT
jgi:pimeloyl-ACP methyl ester carboxylesterase